MLSYLLTSYEPACAAHRCALKAALAPQRPPTPIRRRAHHHGREASQGSCGHRGASSHRRLRSRSQPPSLPPPQRPRRRQRKPSSRPAADSLRRPSSQQPEHHPHPEQVLHELSARTLQKMPRRAHGHRLLHQSGYSAPCHVTEVAYPRCNKERITQMQYLLLSSMD